jgi:hypothetical protein
MTMMAFHTLFPEEARNESRAITMVGHEVLPDRTFLFVESYCVEHACDCRRVMIHVIDTDRREQVATINHGFEPPKPPFEDEGQTFLDPLNPQSSLSGTLLRLFEEMIGEDEGYRRRLERHYGMWKKVVNDPSHPGQAKIRSSTPGYGILPRREPARRTRPGVGANDPCPCGSGRKFKRCCRSVTPS